MAKRGRPKKVVNANPLENPVDAFNDEPEGGDVDFIIVPEPIKAKAAQSKNAGSIGPVWNNNHDRRSAFLIIFTAMMRNRNRFEDYVVDEAIKATDKLFDKYSKD